MVFGLSILFVLQGMQPIFIALSICVGGMCLSLPNDSGFWVVDEGLKWIHSIRTKSQYLVEILIDPWNEKSAIWEIDSRTFEFKKSRGFDDYKDREYTENMTW